MGVRDIGFSSVTNNAVSRKDEEIWDDSDRTGTYLVWATDSGTGTHESFTIAISWSGIPKGQTQMTAQSETITKTVPISQCNEHTNAYTAGTFWAVGLSVFDDLLSELGTYTGDNVTFDGRNYDYISFNVSICANYANPEAWGAESSPYENDSLSLIFVPIYNITDVYYDTPEVIVVEYSADNWARFDDRWALHRCKISDGSTWFLNSESIIATNTWGTVAKYGRIEIPATAFTTSLMNKKIRLMIRWVASYLPTGFSFADDTVEITVDSKIVKNTPTLSLASNDNRTVELNVGDSGDNNAPLETITVKMEGGRYTVDTVTVEKQGSTWPQATFRYCPYNTPLTFTAIGTSGLGASSPVSVSGITLKNSNKYSFDSIVAPEEEDNEVSFDLVHDVQPDISVANNQSTVQLAGRRRPSAFYGSGGTCSLGFSGTLIDDDANDFLALAQADSTDNVNRDLVVRFPDGKRYGMVVESCEVGWEFRQRKDVSISGQEVDV